MEIYFLIDSSFWNFYQRHWKVCTISQIHIIKPLFLNDHNTFSKKSTFIIGCVVWFLKIIYNQRSDLTHNIMNVCNQIKGNGLGLVLELTFSCSSQLIFLYQENDPPLVLSQDQHSWYCTCKLEVGGHDKTSSVVHIYT